jgi:ribonucleoside-diphosphate reductase beta chain
MLDWSEPTTKPKAPLLHPAFAKAPKPVDTTGLGTIERGGARVSVDEKWMINTRALT